jgi:hypothetical protein
MAEFGLAFGVTTGFIMFASGYMFYRFLKTRFTPHLLISLIFFCLAGAFVSFIPLYVLKESMEVTVQIFIKIAAIWLIGALILFIFFIESIWKRPLSFVSAIFLCYNAVVLGMIWTMVWPAIYEGGQGWTPVIFPDLIRIVGFDFLFIISIPTYRFMRYRNERQGKPFERLSKLLTLFGISVIALTGVIGLYFLQIRPFIFVFVLLVGSILSFGAYISDPNRFFLSNAKIHQLLIFDGISGMDYLTIGARTLAAEGIFGSTLIQKEVSEAKQNPKKIVFLDKVFLIASELLSSQHPIYAILISDKDNGGLYDSLKWMLKKFVAQYQVTLLTNANEVSLYSPFIPKIMTFFDYAWSKLERKRILKSKFDDILP